MPKFETSADVELMRRFMAGDEDAFEALVTRYEEPLLNFFFKLTRDRQASEDLLQETFLRILRSRDTYTVRATFRTFIYRIARNLWIDRYRSTKNRPHALSLNSTGKEVGSRPVEETIAGSSPAPADRLEFKETRGLLGEAIADLPETQREVFVLWLETGLKYAEISSILGIPVGTIKSRMHTAVHRLKEALRRHLEK